MANPAELYAAVVGHDAVAVGGYAHERRFKIEHWWHAHELAVSTGDAALARIIKAHVLTARFAPAVAPTPPFGELVSALAPPGKADPNEVSAAVGGLLEAVCPSAARMGRPQFQDLAEKLAQRLAEGVRASAETSGAGAAGAPRAPGRARKAPRPVGAERAKPGPSPLGPRGHSQ